MPAACNYSRFDRAIMFAVIESGQRINQCGLWFWYKVIPKRSTPESYYPAFELVLQDHPWYDAASIRLQQQAATPDNILWGNWQASMGLPRRLLWRQRCGLPHNSDSSRVHLWERSCHALSKSFAGPFTSSSWKLSGWNNRRNDSRTWSRLSRQGSNALRLKPALLQKSLMFSFQVLLTEIGLQLVVGKLTQPLISVAALVGRQIYLIIHPCISALSP